MCLDNSKQPDSITLFAEDVLELRRQQELIESQERILSALRDHMEGFLNERYGVDVAREEWELDLQTGTLIRMT